MANIIIEESEQISQPTTSTTSTQSRMRASSQRFNDSCIEIAQKHRDLAHRADNMELKQYFITFINMMLAQESYNKASELSSSTRDSFQNISKLMSAESREYIERVHREELK